MNSPDLRDPKTDAVELTQAAVSALYGASCQTQHASALARWHLDIAQALLSQKTLPDPTHCTEVWHMTERVVQMHYRATCREVDDETVRVTAVLQMDFVRKCIELLSASRTATAAE